MDAVIGKLTASRQQDQRIALHFHQADAILLNIECLIDPEGIAIVVLRAPDIDPPFTVSSTGLGGMKSEESFVRLKIDTFRSGTNRPDIIKLAVLGPDKFHE